ncbi:TRAP transporter substrate-binding protein [Telmatospirillum sp. J64-1]|uniref:TRAP transporter substrate-binding protein n=1 Tax=Telmatospirillum sp. J64-1 TaxID=2502183 RepID=UPI00115E21D6|nr:TRAP transporter substrate-binding protein [Telmatospirillum sp. J64-1]
MDRRQFLKSSALGAAGVAAASSLAAPAIAQGRQQWTMVTSWPRNLPGPGVAANLLAQRITALSGGRLEVRVSPAGELVPGQGVFDAVSEGTAELYHSVPAYWGSKSIGFLLFGSQPFGLTAIEQSGWINHGGGQALYDELYGRFNVKPFLCGNSGAQWFGWFRNEIKSVDDLRGMRFRTTGLNSEVLSRLGMAVQAMGGADMFQALQSGTLDAGEFIGPWSDSALGFYQVAKNYYYPCIGEPSSAEECGINLNAFNALPDDLKQAVQYACQSLHDHVLTEYNTNHAKALQMLVNDHGVQIRRLPDDVILAVGNASGQLMNELREHQDELVRRITDSFLAYRTLTNGYMRYAEGTYFEARAMDYSFPA